jgi:hypothetical protein
MVEALESFGGAAHPSTLAQYAMSVWGRKDADDEDAGKSKNAVCWFGHGESPMCVVAFDFQDYRKAVKAELKRNPEMFERVSGRGQFTEWKLTEEEVIHLECLSNSFIQQLVFLDFSAQTCVGKVAKCGFFATSQLR